MTIDPQKAVETLQKRYKKQNEYIRNSYDRISVTLPKGTKERIQATGESANGYIARLVLEDLERREPKTDPQKTDGLPDFMKD